VGEADKIYQRALDLWGSDSQLGMVQEECAELISEINRFRRGRASKETLAEECADVIIMARQLRLMLGPDLVDDAFARKNTRLLERVPEAEVLIRSEADEGS
jgi:NTP pyrophosphatase (non-canonical NTP hydrolase)